MSTLLERLRRWPRNLNLNQLLRVDCQRAADEIEQLHGTLDKLLYDAQGNGFIGDNIDDAIEWAVRQMAEAHRLRREQRFCSRCKAAIDEGHDRG